MIAYKKNTPRAGSQTFHYDPYISRNWQLTEVLRLRYPHIEHYTQHDCICHIEILTNVYMSLKTSRSLSSKYYYCAITLIRHK